MSRKPIVKRIGETNVEIARRLATKFENGSREEVATELVGLTGARASNICLLLGRWLTADMVGTLRVLLENHIN